MDKRKEKRWSLLPGQGKKDDREKWISMFKEADLRKEGFLRGTTFSFQESLTTAADLVMKIFARAKLPASTLQQIWFLLEQFCLLTLQRRLVDLDEDGKLNCEEFVKGMHLGFSSVSLCC